MLSFHELRSKYKVQNLAKEFSFFHISNGLTKAFDTVFISPDTEVVVFILMRLIKIAKCNSSYENFIIVILKRKPYSSKL